MTIPYPYSQTHLVIMDMPDGAHNLSRGVFFESGDELTLSKAAAPRGILVRVQRSFSDAMGSSLESRGFLGSTITHEQGA